MEDEKEKPVVAPGDEDYLEKEASPEEIRKGEYTRVTELSFDEVEPSEE